MTIVIGKRLLNRLTNMFGKLRKTKDLAKGEYLIGKPDKIPSLRVLAYGLPCENQNITFVVYDHDEYELDEQLQKEVLEIWNMVSDENINDVTDLQGYIEDFLLINGFSKEDYSLFVPKQRSRLKDASIPLI